MAQLPLMGIRIVDLTRVLAGPFATMILGDLGAEVLKIEEPGKGDDTRGWGPPFVDGTATYFLSVNRNKKSVAVDLKTEPGKKIFRKLLAQSDVLVENFRPGTLERLGFSWQALRELQPRLVYCSISGYGHSSRYASEPSYDILVQGESGLMDLTGFPDGPPTKVGISIADLCAGLWAVQGILLGLYRREKTGQGERIDLSLFDGILSLMSFQAERVLAGADSPRRMGNEHPNITPYETFRASDGFFNVAVGNESQWSRFCQAIGKEDFLRRADFRINAERVRHRAALRAELDGVFRTRTVDAWCHKLREFDVPCGRVRSLAEACEQAAKDIRGMILEVTRSDGKRLAMVGSALAVESSRNGGTYPPALGEHTEEVLSTIGYSQTEIAEMRRQQVVA